MRLALFTPAAKLWPVLRNFDVFIATLGEVDDHGGRLPSIELQARLQGLQEDLYRALLHPSEVYAGDSRTMAEVFWPDLRGTAIDHLLEAFFFYFARRVAIDLNVPDGLSVLRAVFFNHESTDPMLWLLAAERRLAAMRGDQPAQRVEFVLPSSSRLQELAFVINSRVDAAPVSTDWCWGSVRRRPDGLSYATVECGIEPCAIGGGESEIAIARIAARLRANFEVALGLELVAA